MGKIAAAFIWLAKWAFTHTKLEFKIQNKDQIYMKHVFKSYSSVYQKPSTADMNGVSAISISDVSTGFQVKQGHQCWSGSPANLQRMPDFLGMRGLRWLGHVKIMDSHRIPKSLLHREQAKCKISKGSPTLWWKQIYNKCLAKFEVKKGT